MKIDPFELHPSIEGGAKSSKKRSLTRKEISLIIDKEIQETESLPPSTWGYTRDDIIERLESLKEKMENQQ